MEQNRTKQKSCIVYKEKERTFFLIFFKLFIGFDHCEKENFVVVDFNLNSFF